MVEALFSVVYLIGMFDMQKMWRFKLKECIMTQQEEYESLLSTMDWWYDRSDDYSVYSKGKRQWERICQLMKVIDKDQSIYKSYVEEK